MKANSNIPREISQLLDQALTVEELIDILQGYDANAKVVFQCDYGDITHTKQALAVRIMRSSMTVATLSSAG